MTQQSFGGELRRLREQRGLSLQKLAKLVHYDPGYLSKVENGRKPPTATLAARCDAELDADGALAALASAARTRTVRHPADPDELQAAELARRVAATDLGAETLARLESAVDDIATDYPITPPDELLAQVRVHLNYVSRLIDARATLDERRRLLVVGGWLALLAATLHIDLEQRRPARGWLATAASLAQQAGHEEIQAWRYETEAWQVLTDGDYRRAVALSQTAQLIAPRGSSVAIQATAQEGRAWARLGVARDTYDAINRVNRLAASRRGGEHRSGPAWSSRPTTGARSK